MARQPEIRYIRFYTDGSAARQQELRRPEKHKTALPKVRRQKKQIVYLDPLAWAGIVISLVMLALMLVGNGQISRLEQENARLENYLCALENQNADLTYTYRADLDLEEIEALALSLGMIPQEQAQTVTIRIPPRQEEAEPSVWESFTAFLAGLFA